MNKYISWEEAVRLSLSDPKLQKLAFDSYFGDPVEVADRYHKSEEFKEIKKIIPKNHKRALDLGAGNGILSWALAKEGWDVTAVEPDSSDLVGAGAIRLLAKKTNININVIEAKGEDIPLESANFDLVIARQVLHHADDLDAFCKEMYRLSSDCATLITLRDHVISKPSQLKDFLNKHPLHYLYGGENAYTMEQYKSSISQSGLSIIKEIGSFSSVINFAPLSKNDIKNYIAEMTRWFKPITRLMLKIIPFNVISRIASFIDNRPGRLVTFVMKKTGVHNE